MQIKVDVLKASYLLIVEARRNSSQKETDGAPGVLAIDRHSPPATGFPLNQACGLASAVMCAVDSRSLPDGGGKSISYASHTLTS